MKKTLVALLSFSFSLSVVLLVFATTLPAQYKISTQIVIEAAPEKVFQELVDMNSWKNWCTWVQRDPNMSLINSSNIPQVHIEDIITWQSLLNGNGKITIEELITNSFLRFRLSGDRITGVTDSYFSMNSIENSTAIIWKISGELGLLERLYWHFFKVEQDLMADFQLGLFNIKQLAESRPSA